MIKKKLTPASIVSQKKWGALPIGKKNDLRKKLKDTDKDGVPNKFDCRPKNRRKQEAFLSQDGAFLSATSHIEPDKFLGDGLYGSVYTVKGNNNMVIKMPNGFVPNGDTPKNRRTDVQVGGDAIKREADIYKNLSLEPEALFTPTRAVNIGRCDVSSEGFVGLVRPRVKTIDEMGAKVTKEQLESLRQKLIAISSKGYALMDGVQVGIDPSGRILQYDLDYISRTSVSRAYVENNIGWANYLKSIGLIGKHPKIDKHTTLSTCLSLLRDCVGKYGLIEPMQSQRPSKRSSNSRRS